MTPAAPSALRQVAMAAGGNLDATLAFWSDALLLPLHARFDPPGIAFVYAGGARLFFAAGNKPSTVYLDVKNLEAFCAWQESCGVVLAEKPGRVHVDADGTFGPAGEAEWMAFVRDPAGNTIGLVERRRE
jgi:catechol 2,3-dioxygenase-like lactoylglutathione lyase family enzyme